MAVVEVEMQVPQLEEDQAEAVDTIKEVSVSG
jgi:hypothetical protein